MKLRVQEIHDAGGLDQTFSIPAGQIPFDLPDHPILLDPVETHIHAVTDDDEVYFFARVSAKSRMTCSRCLERYEAPLAATFEVHAPLSQAFVDLVEEVRQSLLLAVPVKPLCRPNCLGICPQCGKNLNQIICSCAGAFANSPFKKLKDFKIH